MHNTISTILKTKHHAMLSSHWGTHTRIQTPNFFFEFIHSRRTLQVASRGHATRTMFIKQVS